MDLNKEIQKIQNNIQSKNIELAISQCNKLIQKYPHNSVLHNLGGLALQQFKKIKLSVNYFQKAIDLDPKNLAAKNNLANSLKVLGKLDLAEKLYNDILKINPNNVKCLNNYGNLKQQFNDYDGAIEFYTKALSQDQTNTTILLSLASSYQGIGNFDKAKETVNIIIKINPNMMSAHKLLSGIINYQNDQTHLNDMLELSKSKSLTDSQYIDLFFAIGKAYEDLKQYEKSFEYIRKANEIKNTIINYDFKQEINKFKSIKNTFKNVDFKNTINKNRDSNIIFICGMPRSGTTLVEQIIASHKKVSGAGELIYLQKSIEKNFFNNDMLNEQTVREDIFAERTKLNDDYYELLNLHNVKSNYITDKAPQNFRWIGFIKIFFPNSKIIHCTRISRDICLSFFKNSFASTDMNWSYTQENIANYYNLYRDIMNFWNETIGEFIYEINYEKLIKNKDNEIKNLLDFCNLEFDPACLNHHKKTKTPIKTVSVAQARKPIYSSSVDKNKFYESNLSKMFSMLE